LEQYTSKYGYKFECIRKGEVDTKQLERNELKTDEMENKWLKCLKEVENEKIENEHLIQE
jgi:hypothetical protein